MSGENARQRLYLGLDLSTQQLKSVVIDEELNTIAEEAIHFNDRSLLVHHVQPNGFVIDKNDNRCITTSVLVFLEALGKKKPFLTFDSILNFILTLDVLFQKLRNQKKFDFTHIVGISGI